MKGNIHWVSAKHAHAAEIRVYDRLFKTERPESADDLNPNTLKTIAAQLEPSLAKAGDEPFQFERHGYYKKDGQHFLQTVGLKDSWQKKA